MAERDIMRNRTHGNSFAPKPIVSTCHLSSIFHSTRISNSDGFGVSCGLGRWRRPRRSRRLWHPGRGTAPRQGNAETQNCVRNRNMMKSQKHHKSMVNSLKMFWRCFEVDRQLIKSSDNRHQRCFCETFEKGNTFKSRMSMSELTQSDTFKLHSGCRR